ncbi:MAG TPA: TonB-dependent receptor plug domain-containing protein [Steroidobacteraceae bacterium]|nr:TonB-dependent receptor plug domain-containing protein [Steroidobacteraceae bacterium]
MRFGPILLLFVVLCCYADEPLQEVVVTASLRPQSLEDIPASVTVLDAGTIRAAGEQHFEDLIGLVPNLNWAGDTSRPRYFQIRGIGELEQYQGAPNPSVGFLIDDIDFSGLGSAATLFDIDHVEVLRGPQSARYGANALAGLIYVQSAAPADHFLAQVDLGAADYSGRSYGAVVSGPVEALDSGFRLGVQKYTSDGFYHNAFLDRSDTNSNDELTVRGRWRYAPSDKLRIDLTLLDVRIDNGYDAWTIDNSRTTQSDHPGEDVQHSTGAALHLEYTGASTALTLIGTYADSRVRYGFDSDWGNPVLWAPYTYDYTDTQTRERRTNSFEARLASHTESRVQWLAGIYTLQLKEDFNDVSPGQYVDPFDPTQDSTTLSQTVSAYSSRNTALFGELDGSLSQRWRWSAGLRGERRTAEYHDVTTDSPPHAFAPVDHLWGGDISVDYSVSKDQRLYALLARGYKAGGFNLGPGLPEDQILFTPESDLNLELGYKAELAEHALRLDADVFYIQRRSLQLKTGEQLVPEDPTTFVLYTANAPSGYNYGLESSLQWRASASFEVGATLGLLQTAFHGLTLAGEVQPDHALPHAPDWQASLSGTWSARGGFYVRADLTGTGSFYFDVPSLDPNKSDPYVLINLKTGVRRDAWSADLWVRNLADRRYAVRGFYFGDAPPDFSPQQYIQLGSPRELGGSFTYTFH